MESVLLFRLKLREPSEKQNVLNHAKECDELCFLCGPCVNNKSSKYPFVYAWDWSGIYALSQTPSSLMIIQVRISGKALATQQTVGIFPYNDPMRESESNASIMISTRLCFLRRRPLQLDLITHICVLHSEYFIVNFSIC